MPTYEKLEMTCRAGHHEEILSEEQLLRFNRSHEACRRPAGICFVHGPYYEGGRCPLRDEGCDGEPVKKYLEQAHRLWVQLKGRLGAEDKGTELTVIDVNGPAPRFESCFDNGTPLGQEYMSEALVDSYDASTTHWYKNTDLFRYPCGARRLNTTREAFTLESITCVPCREKAAQDLPAANTAVHWYQSNNRSVTFPCGETRYRLSRPSDEIDAITCEPCKKLYCSQYLHVEDMRRAVARFEDVVHWCREGDATAFPCGTPKAGNSSSPVASEITCQRCTQARQAVTAVTSRLDSSVFPSNPPPDWKAVVGMHWGKTPATVSYQLQEGTTLCLDCGTWVVTPAPQYLIPIGWLSLHEGHHIIKQTSTEQIHLHVESDLKISLLTPEGYTEFPASFSFDPENAEEQTETADRLTHVDEARQMTPDVWGRLLGIVGTPLASKTAEDRAWYEEQTLQLSNLLPYPKGDVERRFEAWYRGGTLDMRTALNYCLTQVESGKAPPWDETHLPQGSIPSRSRGQSSLLRPRRRPNMKALRATAQAINVHEQDERATLSLTYSTFDTNYDRERVKGILKTTLDRTALALGLRKIRHLPVQFEEVDV